MKNFFIKPDDIVKLVETDKVGIASDRIIVDGMEIGFIYRDFPNNGHHHHHHDEHDDHAECDHDNDECKHDHDDEGSAHESIDSGWRFVAGDEDTEYMNNLDNHGIYELNTICNYDRDIIPILDADYGSSFYRNEEGKLVLDED